MPGRSRGRGSRWPTIRDASFAGSHFLSVNTRAGARQARVPKRSDVLSTLSTLSTAAKVVPPRVAAARPGCQRVPGIRGQAIEVVDDLAVTHRQLARQPLGAVDPAADGIREAKPSFLHAQHRQVAGGADRQVSKLPELNRLRRVP